MRHSGILIHLAGGDLVLPWTHPAQPPGFRRRLLGSLHQKTGHRSHRIPADQASFITRSPPLRYLAKGEPLVPEFHRTVGAVGVEARAVTDPLPPSTLPWRWTSHHSPLLLNARPNELSAGCVWPNPCGVPGWSVEV